MNRYLLKKCQSVYSYRFHLNTICSKCGYKDTGSLFMTIKRKQEETNLHNDLTKIVLDDYADL